MRPRELIQQWVVNFNNADAEALSALYAENAINHQVNDKPIVGREAIKETFKEEFDRAEMVCVVENIFEEGEWAILEWKDPLGLRGCGFFHIQDDKIIFQRGYWDMLTFLRQHNLPLPKE